MKTKKFLATIAAGAMALPLIAAHEGIETADFLMNGAQEATADNPQYKGDETGEAIASVRIPEDDGTAICLRMELTVPLSDAAGALTGLHIHEAGRNEAGAVSVDLTSLIGDLAEDGFVDACIDDPTDTAGNPVAGAELADIVFDGREPNGTTNGHPSGFTDEYYLNLHTENFAPGALRGQIKGQQYQSRQRPTPDAG